MNVTRRQAREWAVQMLVAADLNPPGDVASFVEECWTMLCDLGDEDVIVPRGCGKMKAFAEARVAGVLSSLAEIDRIIEGLLVGWDLYRLGTVERTVLRMGVWELKNADVPKAVVINEAVDLSNWFASPKTRTIVNGVLDRYAKSLS